jgi:predicted transcriptional regulator
MNEAQSASEGTQFGNFDSIELTANIVSAFVGSPNNRVDAGDIPGLITSIHSTLTGLGAPQEIEQAKQEPAVSIRASVKPDYVVCLEDGKKLKMLKRHLMTHYNMTPDQYRQKWGLNADYPMVAPNYAETRRALAKKIGLGTSRTRKVEDSGSTGGKAASSEAPKAKRGRKPAVAKSDDAPKRRGRPKKNADAA